jgi:hypothetical protein
MPRASKKRATRSPSSPQRSRKTARRPRERAAAPITVDERARRALVRAIDVLTELVTISSDPGDQNGDPAAFVVVPDDLFLKTFNRVGLDDDEEMRMVKAGLMLQLPEIKPWIHDSLKLKPDMEIGLVWRILRLRLGGA